MPAVARVKKKAPANNIRSFRVAILCIYIIVFQIDKVPKRGKLTRSAYPS